MKRIIVVLIAAGCTSVSSESVRNEPTGFLCRLLDSKEYITTPEEQRVIYSELERRGAECLDANLKVKIE